MGVTIVQTKAAATVVNSTSLSVVFDTAPTQDNRLLAFASSDALLTMASSGWTLTMPEVVNFTALDMWHKNAGAGESSTVTINIGGTTTAELIVAEVSGLTASPLDQTVSNNPGSNSTTISTGTTGTTAQANEIAFAACSYNDSPGTAGLVTSWSNGFVEIPLAGGVKGIQGTGAAMDTWLGVGYKVLSAVGTVESTATLAGQGGRPIGLMATYKIASIADNTTKPGIAGSYDPQLVGNAWF